MTKQVARIDEPSYKFPSNRFWELIKMMQYEEPSDFRLSPAERDEEENRAGDEVGRIFMSSLQSRKIHKIDFFIVVHVQAVVVHIHVAQCAGALKYVLRLILRTSIFNIFAIHDHAIFAWL